MTTIYGSGYVADMGNVITLPKQAHAAAVSADLSAENERLRDTLRETQRKFSQVQHILLMHRDMLERERDALWEALELIAAPMRPDGTWNRERLACQQIAIAALKGASHE